MPSCSPRTCLTNAFSSHFCLSRSSSVSPSYLFSLVFISSGVVSCPLPTSPASVPPSCRSAAPVLHTLPPRSYVPCSPAFPSSPPFPFPPFGFCALTFPLGIVTCLGANPPNLQPLQGYIFHPLTPASHFHSALSLQCDARAAHPPFPSLPSPPITHQLLGPCILSLISSHLALYRVPSSHITCFCFALSLQCCTRAAYPPSLPPFFFCRIVICLGANPPNSPYNPFRCKFSTL